MMKRWILLLCSILALVGPAMGASRTKVRKNANASAPRTEAAPLNETGPRLDDPTFFGMLDLSRPDLAAVKTAVERADWPAATHAFAVHLRTRTTPRWNADSQRSSRRSRGRDGDAAKVMRHLLSSLGIEWQFGEKIDWAFNPTTQPGSKWARNHEWTWQLNRHPMWIDLARAYRATGDEQYAAEFAKELQSWVHDCPVPVKSADNAPYSRWRTIEAGIRAGSVWPSVFHSFLNAKSVDDPTLILMVKSYVEHAQYLIKFKTHGNWLTMESNGLYHVGALFPEFKDARLWRDTAIGRLDAELTIQVYPDGAQTELAPNYHGVALHNFLGPVELVPLTDFELPAQYLAKIEKMFDYYLYCMQPTGVTPPLNDSGAGEVRRELAVGAQLFPNRKDFLWVATEGRQGTPPAHTSFEFPYAGQFMMRGGWGLNDLYLCMDGGPFSTGHQHEDKLSIILTAYGKPLLVEGGVFTYDASEWRKYVLSSRAHNLVLVDGLEQNRRHSSPSTYLVKTPLPHVWQSDAIQDHAAATYEEGWGPKGDRLVKQTRQVWFLKAQGCFVVEDELESLDGKPHTCEALFHLDAPEAQVKGLAVATQNAGPNLTILAQGAEGVKIIKGQKDPVQGWLPDGSLGYGGIRPIPTAVYSKKSGEKTTRMAYLLVPTPAGKACPVGGFELKDGAVSLTMADGKKQEVALKR